MPRNSATPILQLGLISCKVGANPATDKRPSNTNICDDGHEIVACKQTSSGYGGGLHCPTCGKPPNGKARQVATGSFVKLDQADLDAVAEEAKAFKGVVNLTPHPAEQMTKMLPAADGKVYTLAPYDAAAADNYQLVLQLVRRHPELCFTAVWTVSSVPAMYRLGEYEDVLVLTELAWPDAIRELPVCGGTVNAALAPMAEQFLTTLVTDFDPSTYVDTGKARLDAIVAAGQVVTSGAATSVPAQPADLMAALKAAVDAATPTPIGKAPSKRKKAA